MLALASEYGNNVWAQIVKFPPYRWKKADYWKTRLSNIRLPLKKSKLAFQHVESLREPECTSQNPFEAAA